MTTGQMFFLFLMACFLINPALGMIVFVAFLVVKGACKSIPNKTK